MSDRNSEDIIGALYDMVQDARSMPLAADKCILERDKVLDMLDEIIAQLPAELKQSRTIVESRNELISQARREAENIVRQAQEQEKAVQINSGDVRPSMSRPRSAVRSWLVRLRRRLSSCARPETPIWTIPCVRRRRLSPRHWRKFGRRG